MSYPWYGYPGPYGYGASGYAPCYQPYAPLLPNGPDGRHARNEGNHFTYLVPAGTVVQGGPQGPPMPQAAPVGQFPNNGYPYYPPFPAPMQQAYGYPTQGYDSMNSPYAPPKAYYNNVPYYSDGTEKYPHPVYGRTKEQVDWDNREVAARTGMNGTFNWEPTGYPDHQMFWVQEVDGGHTQRHMSVIKEACQPGYWVQKPHTMWVRTKEEPKK